MTRRFVYLLCAALFAAGVFGACGDDTKVGSGVNTNFDEKVGERLGEATTTTAGPSTTARGNNSTATTGAANRTPTTAAIKYQEVALSASGFDTNPIRVYVGTPIRFTNKDSKPRTISGASGEFNSGTIAPGGQYVFTPKAPASIDVATDVPFHTTHIDAIAR